MANHLEEICLKCDLKLYKSIVQIYIPEIMNVSIKYEARKEYSGDHDEKVVLYKGTMKIHQCIKLEIYKASRLELKLCLTSTGFYLAYNDHIAMKSQSGEFNDVNISKLEAYSCRTKICLFDMYVCLLLNTDIPLIFWHKTRIENFLYNFFVTREISIDDIRRFCLYMEKLGERRIPALKKVVNTPYCEMTTEYTSPYVANKASKNYNDSLSQDISSTEISGGNVQEEANIFIDRSDCIRRKSDLSHQPENIKNVESQECCVFNDLCGKPNDILNIAETSGLPIYKRILDDYETIICTFFRKVDDLTRAKITNCIPVRMSIENLKLILVYFPNRIEEYITLCIRMRRFSYVYDIIEHYKYTTANEVIGKCLLDLNCFYLFTLCYPEYDSAFGDIIEIDRCNMKSQSNIIRKKRA